MTTKIKNKQLEITRTIMDGQEVLGTVLNKRKYYFLADLKKLYGTKFMTYLPTNPIALRIAVSGNSQTRQLVNVSDFKASFRSYKQALKAKFKDHKQPTKGVREKPSKTEIKAAACDPRQLDMLFEPQDCTKTTRTTSEALVVKTPTKLPEVSLTVVSEIPKAHINSPVLVAKESNIPKLSIENPIPIVSTVVDSFNDVMILERRWKAIRSEVCKIMRAHVVRTHAPRNSTRSETNKLWDKHSKDYYTKAYKKFDKQLAMALNTDITGLIRMGYGRENRNYMDVIQEKGLLEEFKQVVIDLYGNNYAN